MDIVVDTNILFSALTYSRTVQRLLTRLYKEGHTLHAPTELIVELEKHRNKIERFSPLPPRLLKDIIKEVLPRILYLHPTNKIPSSTINKAKRLVEAVDPSDWPFVALAIYLNVPLWTGDKQLIRLALKTGEFRAVDTHGVEMLLEGRSWHEVEEEMRKRYLRESRL